MGNHRGLLGNYPSNYVSYCISIYIIDKCNNSRTFCDLGVPWLPRAISYYILVIGKEGKWQSPLMAPGDFRGIKAI